jgi:signal transduction histidine kinase
MSRRSFRSRLLIGSLLWTAGLLAVGHMLSLMVIHHFPILVRIDHVTVFALAAILMALGFAQLRSGLSPYDRLRGRLTAVRNGDEARVEGQYPSELQPLVDELNGLLEDREQKVRRALAKAGDLAHGLKTPLAVLAVEADRAEAAGEDELASTLGQQVERMRRQIDYHLAHARAAAAGNNPAIRSSVLESTKALARTLLRLHAGRGIAIAVNVAPEHSFRGQREDLDELLGNLLDNSCKWGRSQVAVSSTLEEGMLVIAVDDDGPGIDPAMRDQVLQRGVRADEATSGSGLGLAIVRDLAELYGGSISLTSSPQGGTRAELRLPAG